LPGPVSLEQVPALAERGRLRLQHFFAWLDARLADGRGQSSRPLKGGRFATDITTKAECELISASTAPRSFAERD
jgi:hypothetical protein